jgi:hypothetical protein
MMKRAPENVRYLGSDPPRRSSFQTTRQSPERTKSSARASRTIVARATGLVLEQASLVDTGGE